ncbi:MAG: hypothetical protein E7576_11610 [Ruminococcaceae bacterium]|nr:hypothetical protein [Oscillospiraceae bacterium]
MTICIIEKSAGLSYAAGELCRFLAEFTNAELARESGPGSAANADRRVTVEIDGSLPAHCWSIRGDGETLEIRGGSPSAAYCGVCDALADAGILFTADGYSAPLGFDPDRLFGIRKDVCPKFRLRGIRQHINFPMDISSYSLKEAKAYIRSIARMRYNAITFHSYPGQWHETRPDDPNDHAGHFFYGQVHPIPAADPLTASRIENRRIYCIPEAEEIFGDERKRADFARIWLNEVMKTAKEAGMTVTLSVEILSDNIAVEGRMLRVLCETYPLIDTLELISEECGGFRDQPGVTRENVTEFLTGLFGEGILGADGRVPGMPEHLPGQLGSSAVCLSRMLRVLEDRAAWLDGLSKKPKIRAGLYLTDRDTLRVLRPILRDNLPEGMTMSLLPAHGALAAADNIESTGTLPGDWQNTMFYSWAEFDGNMFIQQMSTEGIEKLVSLPPTDSSYGFAINHWRTAENTLAISYAAEAGISATDADAFYHSYAKRRGISDGDGFAALCHRLARADTYNRDNLFNIGFCAVGCWLNWHRQGDYMKPRGFALKDYRHAIAEFEAAIGEARALLPSSGTREGTGWLRLMINRCGASILHVRSMMTLEELNDVFDFDHPEPVEDEERAAKIKDILRRSRNDAEAYLHLYGEILPDRGGEGQLVSYYETTLVYIDAVTAPFTKSGAAMTKETYDAPPMPDPEAR